MIRCNSYYTIIAWWLRGYIDMAMAKQTRTMVYIMAGFALTTWVSMAGVIIAFVSLAP